jgi:hypothetical protein
MRQMREDREQLTKSGGGLLESLRRARRRLMGSQRKLRRLKGQATNPDVKWRRSLVRRDESHGRTASRTKLEHVVNPKENLDSFQKLLTSYASVAQF